MSWRLSQSCLEKTGVHGTKSNLQGSKRQRLQRGHWAGGRCVPPAAGDQLGPQAPRQRHLDSSRSTATEKGAYDFRGKSVAFLTSRKFLDPPTHPTNMNQWINGIIVWNVSNGASAPIPYITLLNAPTKC